MINSRVRSAFDRSAPRYDEYADFQNNTANELAWRIAGMGFSGAAALDAGCGTGALSAMLEKTGAFRIILAHDISCGMVDVARRRAGAACVRCVQAAAERLPVKNGSIDLIASNLAFQWVEDMTEVFRQAAAALRRGGHIMATTLGTSTFHEIREAMGHALNGAGLGRDESIFHRFTDREELARQARGAGFDATVWSVTRVRVFRDANHLMRVLKGQGVQNSPGLASLGLGRRKVMKRFAEEYAKRFSTEGGVRATYEVIHLDAKLL